MENKKRARRVGTSGKLLAALATSATHIRYAKWQGEGPSVPNMIGKAYMVHLTPQWERAFCNTNRLFNVHKNVLQPLTDQCEFCYVYGKSTPANFPPKIREFLVPSKGKFEIPQKTQITSENALLWNATTWKRGSMLYVFSNFAPIYAAIHHRLYGASINVTPNSGNSPAAIRECKRLEASGKFALLLPASNGIEWATLYGSEEMLTQIFASNVRRWSRWNNLRYSLTKRF